MSATGERLQKVLAAAGIGSRREIESWIEAGRVAVNGRPAVLGQRIGPNDAVSIDGRSIRLAPAAAEAPRVLAYNKPEGEICTRSDPEGRPTVFERLPRLRGSRWVLVGRLDIGTSGLLLLTDSGALANRLMHPQAGLEREYLARVAGPVDEAMLRRLQQGVLLDDGTAAFDAVREQGEAGSGRNRWFAVTLREGRNREVRRLWESQGCTVSRLKRIRFGPVVLGPRERRGTSRELEPAEVRKLCEVAGFALAVPEPVVPKPARSREQRRADGAERTRREKPGSPKRGAARERGGARQRRR